MILKSRKVAIYLGMAIVMMLMPILPATITHQLPEHLMKGLQQVSGKAHTAHITMAH